MEKAVIGNEYYFADDLDSMKGKIKKEEVGKLIGINDTEVATTFKNSGNHYLYACILPVEAVKEEKKKYRPCESLREFYRVVMNEVPTLNMVEDDIIYDLMDSIIHIRNAKSSIEFHLNINGISTELDGTRNVLIGNTYLSFKDLFDNSEIEINGKWLPFGVIDA